MANHPSALKRERQSRKRRLRNRAATSAIKTSVKKLTAALSDSGAADAVKAAFTAAVSTLDRAAGKGIIPKKRASRKVSRLARQVNQATAAAPTPPPTP